MLALAEHKATRCPGGCGHSVEDGISHEKDGPTFAASWIRCRACEAKAMSASAFKGAYPESLLWHVEKTGGDK